MNLKYLLRLSIILLLPFLLFAGTAKTAWSRDEIRVAVATNFIRAMETIAERYEKQTGVQVKISSSASGILYAQIVNNAPFDLFLSADEERPELLYQQGLCDQPFTYATGRVVMWSGRSDLDDAEEWGGVVSGENIRRIAIANPETAPYGTASLNALQERGVLEKVRGRLVYGQNVGQAFQYARQGPADVAFVARSYARSDLGRTGKTWQIPGAQPVVQNGCILNRGANWEDALGLVAFLKSAEIGNVLSTFGYE